MFLTAESAYRKRLIARIENDSHVSDIIERIRAICRTRDTLIYDAPLTDSSKALLTEIGFTIHEDDKDVYAITWTKVISLADIDSSISKIHPKLDNTHKKMNVIIALCIVIILLLLSVSTIEVIKYQTKQVGLVAIIDTPANDPDIPGYDPGAIVPPNDDKVQKLNEKLDKGKMCINMLGRVSFDTADTAGYINIVNDPANNYPQFVTIKLDSDGTQIYQSGLIEVGKSIPYAQLEVPLLAGDYECTAIFSQVDTETNSICGQAAAKIIVTVKS